MPSETASPQRSRRPAADDDSKIPRQSWLGLIPRRSLWKALAMLLLLVAIVLIQRRTEVVVRHLGGLGAPAQGQSR